MRVLGEFVAYWAVLAVFAYYFEVIGRYVFNSPTNWVHESTFLMFGMQYMIAGAYAYRGESHVRVDLVYTKLSPRGKAICDMIGALFFLIFIGTMAWTGWRLRRRRRCAAARSRSPNGASSTGRSSSSSRSAQRCCCCRASRGLIKDVHTAAMARS